MKKTLSLMVAASMAVVVSAQSVDDGVKLLRFEKTKSAVAALQKVYNDKQTDPEAIYWYGQALIQNEDVKGAKAVYQKALQAGVNNAWIWIGMGHVELLEGGDINAAKQKFEQAITATLGTKGKNKGKADPAVLNAIGRANAFGHLADGSSKFGDPTYAIEKLKLAAELDPKDPNILNNLGINYQKLGGENGGEAVKAYMEAINRDPKNAEANWRIGKIYATQQNPLSEEYFNKAIAADATYPPAYFSLYQAYELKDINKAKDYLDKYVQVADNDCPTNYYYADYLFRAGKYQESLGKANEMAAGDCKTYNRLSVLYAYNYDRLNDSVQSKSYLDKYFGNNPTDVQPTDYELAVKVYSKFPGNEDRVAGYLQKAIDNDTLKANRLAYITQAVALFEKAKKYPEQAQWLQKYVELKGAPVSEYDYYRITNAYYQATQYDSVISWAKGYIRDFPAKPQPYSFLKRAAIASDADTSTGAAIVHLDYLDSVYASSPDSAKYKADRFNNLYYQLQYFATKSKEYDKAVAITDRMLALYPTPGEENKYATDTRNVLMNALKKSGKTGSK